MKELIRSFFVIIFGISGMVLLGIAFITFMLISYDLFWNNLEQTKLIEALKMGAFCLWGLLFLFIASAISEEE